MEELHGPKDGRFRSFLRRLRHRIVQPVPRDIELCEFGCRKPHCSWGEWESCARRVKEMSEWPSK